MAIDPASTDFSNIPALGGDNQPDAVDLDIHVVQRGEAIEDIAAQHGVEVQTLLANNPDIVNPETLYPGQMLYVGPGETSVGSPSSSGSVTVTDRGAPTVQEGTPNNGTVAQTGTAITGSGDTVGFSSTTTTTTSSTTLDGQAYDGQLADEPDALQTNGTIAQTFGGSFDDDQNVLTINSGVNIGGNVRSGNGYGFGLQLGANVQVQGGMNTEGGVTTFTLGFDASGTLQGNVRAPIGSLTASETVGTRSSMVVSVPEQLAGQIDPTTIDPLQPETLPIGTRVQLDSANYHGQALSVALRQFALSSRITETEGVSLLVERVGADQVRVTTGPTEAINTLNAAGLDFGNLGRIMLGRADSVTFTSLQTAQFNLATPEGAAAFNDFVTQGQMPDQNSPGNDGAISGVQTVSTLGFESQLRVDAGLGPLGMTGNGPANIGQSVYTTFPNGTVEHVARLQYGGNGPLIVTRTLDATGTEIAGTRTYEFTITPPDDGAAGALNVAISGDGDASQSGPVSAGDTVTWTLSDEDMAALVEMTAQGNTALNRTDGDLRRLIESPTNGAGLPSTIQFAVGLARNSGGDGQGQSLRLQNIADAAGFDTSSPVSQATWDGIYEAVPGSFEISTP